MFIFSDRRTRPRRRGVPITIANSRKKRRETGSARIRARKTVCVRERRKYNIYVDAARVGLGI